MRFRGSKLNKHFLYLSNFIPDKIDIWVEPFGGSFGLHQLFKDRINYSVYNDKDIDTYQRYKDLANESYNLDWKEIITKFDNTKSFFYFDPPYYGREHYYKEQFHEHDELSYYIKNMKSKSILSYNNTDYIRNLYSGFNIINIPSFDIYHKNEIIIF